MRNDDGDDQLFLLLSSLLMRAGMPSQSKGSLSSCLLVVMFLIVSSFGMYELYHAVGSVLSFDSFDVLSALPSKEETRDS